MITVLCLNPAMDRTVLVERLAVGAVHRSQRTFTHAGGKGMNVARAIRRLGEESRVVGFAGGWVADFLHAECARYGVDDLLTPISGETRLCYILVETGDGRSTVVNEAGPPVDADDVARLRADLQRAVVGAACLVISGSAPPGVPASFYAEAVALGSRRGIPVLLDASGDALIAGTAARPWLIKPNGDEVNALIGGECREVRDFARACKRLKAWGAEHVVVSLGAQGCVLLDGESLWHVLSPPVSVRNPVGSGDALVAGVAVAAVQHRSVLDCVRLGVACGAANASSFEPDLPPNLDLAALAQASEAISLEVEDE